MRIKFLVSMVMVLLFSVSLSHSGQVYAVAGQWSSSGNTIYYNDGNIGIGTASPSAKLQIGSGTVVNEAPGASGVIWSQVGGNAYLNSSGVNRINTNKPGAILYLSGEPQSPSSFNFNFATQGTDGSNFSVALFNKDVISFPNGNIGIGTTSPSQKLDVIGNLKTSGLIYPGNINTDIRIGSGSWDGGELKLYSSKHVTAILGENYGNSAFRVTKQDGGEVVTVKLSNYDGNNTIFKVPKHYTVQLGDDSGASEFRVTKLEGGEMMSVNSNGTLRVREVIVSNGWADYVFEDDYRLMPLSEVKNYIEVNKHLPNIPSAYEVESQGLSVGDMQRLQMEKIEELTLHLIEKDREIKSLEERLSRLEILLVRE